MAQPYHKNVFYNSTLVLPLYFFSTPRLPGLEAIVIPLPDNLPFAELQKHRKRGLHLPRSGNGSKGNRQRAYPLDLQRHLLASRYLLPYHILLLGHGLLAPFRALHGLSEVSLLAGGRQPVRKLLQHHIGRKEASERSSCLAPFDSLQILSRDFQIASRFTHVRLREARSSTACAVRCAGLSLSSVPASNFVSFCSELHFVPDLEGFFRTASPEALSRSFTIRSGFTRAFSTVSPQCRCGPVTRPVAPTFPSTSPVSETSPTFTPISERCP